MTAKDDRQIGQGRMRSSECEIVAHVSFRRIDEDRAKTDDVVAGNQCAGAFLVKTKVTACVAGRVHRAQPNLRVSRSESITSSSSIKRSTLNCPVSDSAVDRCAATGTAHPEMLCTVSVQSSPRNVVRMHVSQDNLAHTSPCGDQIINGISQRLLLVFVRRSGIDDQQFFRGVNQITVRVRRRRLCRRAHRKANVIRPKLDAPHRLAMRVGTTESARPDLRRVRPTVFSAHAAPEAPR